MWCHVWRVTCQFFSAFWLCLVCLATPCYNWAHCSNDTPTNWKATAGWIFDKVLPPQNLSRSRSVNFHALSSQTFNPLQKVSILPSCSKPTEVFEAACCLSISPTNRKSMAARQQSLNILTRLHSFKRQMQQLDKLSEILQNCSGAITDAFLEWIPRQKAQLHVLIKAAKQEWNELAMQ